MKFTEGQIEIIEIVIKLMAVILVGYVLPAVKGWLVEKMGVEKIEKIEILVAIFVDAAEQILKDVDPTGIKRKSYVCSRLHELGYEVTDQIEAMIEARVYTLPHTEKEDEYGIYEDDNSSGEE